MHCQHATWTESVECCFAGSIFGAEEDRRAHGGVAWTGTCRGWGAPRWGKAHPGWRGEGPGGPPPVRAGGGRLPPGGGSSRGSRERPPSADRESRLGGVCHHLIEDLG